MRRWPGLALVGVAIAACSGSDFGKEEGTGGQGGSSAAGSPSGGTKSSTAGNSSGGGAGANSAGSQAQSGAAGNGGRAGANSGGSGGKAGSGGSAGYSAGAGGMVTCPPCAAPPAPDCVGSGPCGCGPYVCPSGGAASGEACGPVVCKAPLECCNALMGICTMPGQVCLQ